MLEKIKQKYIQVQSGLIEAVEFAKKERSKNISNELEKAKKYKPVSRDVPDVSKDTEKQKQRKEGSQPDISKEIGKAKKPKITDVLNKAIVFLNGKE